MNLTAGQERVFHELQSRWERLEPGGSRLAVIGGRQGCGKTAIVHALYAWVVSRAADQGVRLVWPPTLTEGSLPRAVARKTVRPTWTIDPWNRLGFAWFGRTCRPGDLAAGAAAELEALISPQMFQALYLESDHASRDIGDQALRALVAFISAGGAGVLFGPAGVAVGAAASWAAFAGQAGQLARKLVSEEAQWRSAMDRVGRLPWHGQGVPSRAEMLADRFSILSDAGLPIVLALEDAHLADESTIALCHALLGSATIRALIVATGETDELLTQMDTGVSFGALLVDDINSSYRPATLTLDGPHPAELAGLIRAVLPTSRERPTVDEIVVAAAGNVERAFSMAERAGSGAVAPSPWDLLPPAAQRYLAGVAALQGNVLYEQPLDRLSGLSRHEQEEGREIALAEGIMVEVDEWRLAFVDPEWHRLARHQAATLFPEGQLRSCRQDLFESIGADKRDEKYWSSLSVFAQATALRDHIGLYWRDDHEDGSARRDLEFGRVGEELVDSLDRLAGIEAVNDQPVAAARALANAVDLIALVRRGGGRINAERELEIVSRYHYLPIAGRSLAGIIDEAASFADALAEKHGADSADHLQARWNVANLHAAVYDYPSAATIAAETLQLASGIISSKLLHQWRHDHADWTGEAGRPADAAELHQQLLPSCVHDFGADHPHTLACRHSLAQWLGHSGRLEEAIHDFERLLVERTPVLGPNHLETLGYRHNLAHWLGEAGRLEEAIAQTERVLAGRTRLLGPDHPDTLTSRHNLASWLGNAGRLEEAIVHDDRVLADRTKVLGPDHPHTLNSRNNLASWLFQAGQLPEATHQFEHVVTDLTRVLGQDHPKTLASRYSLATCLAQAGHLVTST